MKHLRSIPAPVYVVWLALLLLVGIGAVASAAEAAPSQARTCFPAAEWGPAPDSVRPCATLTPNAPEAGALRFSVSDASGIVRYQGFINTPFHRIASVRFVDGIAEDGSLCFSASNFRGKRKGACIGNLQD